MTLTTEIPIRIVSEANARGHWAKGAKRAKDQRATVALVLRSRFGAPPAGAVVVRLVRVAPRALDGDNLARACKAVRDGVADWLGRDDREGPLMRWEYGQRRAARTPGDLCTYAIEVSVEVLT